MVKSYPPQGSRGILTENDREFLLNPEVREEMSASGRSQRWEDIRNRVANGLLDFTYLVRCLPDEQRDRIFEDDRLYDPEDPGHQERVLGHLIAFSHQQLGDEARLENAIADGVHSAELLEGAVTNVYPNVSTHRQTSIREILEQGIENGFDTLTERDVHRIWYSGGLSEETVNLLYTIVADEEQIEAALEQVGEELAQKLMRAAEEKQADTWEGEEEGD